jgi:lipopolysaccharide/colanic/teichoic acid biosynthesis glycosyltransferase
MCNPIIKRILDCLLAFIALPFGIILIVISGSFLYLESPGPIIFKQKRLGKDRRYFTMYKIRKFHPEESEFGRGFTLASDSRCTKVGAILEKIKLDELPQLINILKGDMSIIGPRPITLFFEDEYESKYDILFNYRPGIFGPNQILYRNEGSILSSQLDPEKYYREFLVKDKAERDIDYFQNTSCFSQYILVIKGLYATVFK